MEKIIVTSIVDLTDSGCNACGVSENIFYSLTIGEREITLDEWTVNAVIMAVVTNKGFKPELKMDILEEYVLFKKEGVQVTLKEEYDLLKYSNGTDQIEVKNPIGELSEVLDEINAILSMIFKLDKIEFVI